METPGQISAEIDSDDVEPDSRAALWAVTASRWALPENGC
jgi:hypothetical protein